MDINEYMSENLTSFYEDNGISKFDRNDSIPRELVYIERELKKLDR